MLPVDASAKNVVPVARFDHELADTRHNSAQAATDVSPNRARRRGTTGAQQGKNPARDKRELLHTSPGFHFGHPSLVQDSSIRHLLIPQPQFFLAGSALNYENREQDRATFFRP